MTGGINSVSSFNSASISQMRQDFFNKVDTDGDGYHSKSEVEAISNGHGPGVDEIFSLVDTDSDGLISQIEFEEGSSKLDELRPQEMGALPPNMAMMGGPGGINITIISIDEEEEDSEDLFSIIDTDGNGVISKEEMTAFFEENGLSIDVDSLFREADTDNDGQISRAESDAAMEKIREKKEELSQSEETANDISSVLNLKSFMIQEILNAYNNTDIISSNVDDLAI